MLSVNGGAAIGTYAANSAAPSNGLIVSGYVGIGFTAPINALDIGTTQGIDLAAGTPTNTGYALYNVGGTLYWNGSSLASGGSGTVNSGTQYQMADYATSTNAVSGNSGLTTDANNDLIVAPSTSSTASTVRFSYTGAADTALTASTEAPDAYFNMGQTRQHATGALTTQRDFRITGSNHSFVGASTITNAAALAIDGPPKAGTNATITNSSAIYIPTLALSGGTVTNSYGLNVAATTNAANNYAAYFSGGNVGIGTANPVYSLDVNAGSGTGVNVIPAHFAATTTSPGGVFVSVDALSSTNHQAGIEFSGQGTAKWFVGNSSNNNTTDDFFISSVANGDLLTIGSSSAVHWSVTGGTLYGSVAMTQVFDDHSGAYGVIIGADTTNHIGVVASDGNGGSSSLAFATPNSGTYAERMRIDGSGNVGIGTTAPSSALNVVSSAGTDTVIIKNTASNGWSDVSFLDSIRCYADGNRLCECKC